MRNMDDAEIFLFQSTPPHGRRRRTELFATVDWRVSIHASAREATYLHGGGANVFDSFNPRLRTGGDLNSPKE